GRKQDYYLSLEELVQQRRQEQMRTQGLELVRLIREAEQRGFTADDLQVAMNHCGNDNPINWLRDNWRHMTETVVTLATNYGHDRRDNTIGIVSVSEAQNALRRQKGNIWAAVTECVENRQRMFMELSSRGTFSREEILTALTDNHGNMDMAYAQLTKATLKPFLMRIWGPGTGVDNDEGAQPTLPSPLDSKSDDSVTKRVKDWLESLDASQVPAYRLEAGDGRTQNRHSFHGTRTKDIVGERGRSSSPASSFSSQREASDVSSVSSMTQTTSSRLEAILQRREAQKVYERGRKSKKEVHTDRKRRWTLASVFDGKKIASVVKKDTFDNVESKCQTLTSVTTLASDTTPLDSSSSGATKSSETLASVEATGAKPKTFLGRLSEVATVPRTPSSPDSKQTRQLIDKENIVSTATFTPDASTTTSQKVESPSSSVQALMATQNNDAATTGPPVVVLDRRLSPKEREVEGSAKIDAQEPRHSYDALTQSSSPADKVEVVVSEAETPDEIAPPTTSQQEGQVTRRSRPSRQQDDEATNTTVPRRQGRRLSDTTAPRRRERPQPEGTTSTEMSRTGQPNRRTVDGNGKGPLQEALVEATQSIGREWGRQRRPGSGRERHYRQTSKTYGAKKQRECETGFAHFQSCRGQHRKVEVCTAAQETQAGRAAQTGGKTAYRKADAV
ncbi:hypothetical protein HPB47_007220, partial [Ixodes persulcatus]